MPVQPPAVLPRPRHPAGDGTLVYPERRHYRPGRAAVAQQHHHQQVRLRRLVQPVQRRACGRGERLPTLPADVPVLRPAVYPDVTLPDLPPGGTPPVVAEYRPRVHTALLSDAASQLHRQDARRTRHPSTPTIPASAKRIPALALLQSQGTQGRSGGQSARVWPDALFDRTLTRAFTGSLPTPANVQDISYYSRR